MLTIAVALFVLDGLTTWSLVMRRRRTRRARLGIDRAAAAPQNVGLTAAVRCNDEFERGDANLRAKWWASLETSRPDRTIPVQARPPVSNSSELRRAADRLAATEQVIYDAAFWEA